MSDPNELPGEEILDGGQEEPIAEAPVDGELEEPTDQMPVEEQPEETVTGAPVVATVRPIERAPALALPSVQAAAVAATGFVAGAATFALVRRHGARKVARARRLPPRRASEGLPVIASRTFLVDVHLIGRPEE